MDRRVSQLNNVIILFVENEKKSFDLTTLCRSYYLIILKFMADKDVLRSLKIKTGVLTRTSREMRMYEEEVIHEETVRKEMETTGQDWKQQGMVVDESQNMIKDCSSRLENGACVSTRTRARASPFHQKQKTCVFLSRAHCFTIRHSFALGSFSFRITQRTMIF